MTCLVLLTGPQIVQAAEDAVAIHGFVAQGYMKSTDNNFLTETDQGSFQYNEMGLNFGYDTGGNVKIGAQLFARDLGDVSNDKVSVAWAFGDYKWRDYLGFRAGILKFPLGLYNKTRDVDSLRTSIILPQSVYNEWFRDVGQGIKGVEAYGNVPLGPAGMLTYEFAVVDVQVPLDSGTARYIAQMSDGVTSLEEIDVDTTYVGSFIWNTPLEGLLLGVSGFRTETHYLVNGGTLAIDDPENNSTIFSLEYTYKNLVLASEVSHGSGKKKIYPVAAPEMLMTDNASDTSYYVSASYRFSELFELGTYYSKGISDNDGSGPTNELKDICLSTRFDVTSNMVVKLEAHSMDGLFGVTPSDDGSIDDKWMLFAAKTSFTF